MPKIACVFPFFIYPLNVALVGGSDFNLLKVLSGEIGKRFVERKHATRQKDQINKGIWSVI